MIACCHSCRSASRGHDHERPVTRRQERRLQSRLLPSRRTPSAPGQRSARPCANSPAAMFACGTSSTTSGLRSSAGDPWMRSARRAASAPTSRPGAPVESAAAAHLAVARHPTRRLLEPLLRQPTRPRRFRDRGDERGDRLLVQVVADAERVDAGRERLNAGLLHSHAAADRAHLERVGDHEPVEAELLAQEPGDDPAAQRGRQLVESRGRPGVPSSPP